MLVVFFLHVSSSQSLTTIVFSVSFPHNWSTLLQSLFQIIQKYLKLVPSIDSILFSTDGQSSKNNYDRNNIYLTQAPQGFMFEQIYNAHKIAKKNNMEAISSADLMIELGQEVHIFPGLRNNIKVTTPEDLKSLRAIYYYDHFSDFAKEEMGKS